MSKKLDSTVHAAHAGVMTTVDTRARLMEEVRAIKSGTHEREQAKQQAEQRLLAVLNKRRGYANRPWDYDDQDAAAREAVARRDVAQAEAAIDSAAARLQALQASLDACPLSALPEVLQHHRGLVNAAQERLSALTAARERLSVAGDHAPPADLIRQHEDLLAAAALGDDVSVRLAEVTAQLTAANTQTAESLAQTAATLAGLERRIAAAEVELGALLSQDKALTAAHLRDVIATAADRYQDLAAQTADALGAVLALSDLHAEADPFGAAGPRLAYWGQAWLPDITTGEARLDLAVLHDHKERHVANIRAAMAGTPA